MKKLVLLSMILTGATINTLANTLPKVDKSILVKEDTYIASDEMGKNYGSETLMKPKGTKSFTRVALMKFDVPEKDVKEMKSAQLKFAITFGSGAEDAEYGIYAFENLKWNENDATYTKHEKDIMLDKGQKLGEIRFEKNEKNEAKYYYINITNFLKTHKKGEFTLAIIDDKKGNKNINIRTKENSKKWTPVIEIKK